MINIENHPFALLHEAIKKKDKSLEIEQKADACFLILGRKELELVKEASPDICETYGVFDIRSFSSVGKFSSIQLLEVDADSEFVLIFHEEKSITVLEDLKRKYANTSEIDEYISYLKGFYAIL